LFRDLYKLIILLGIALSFVFIQDFYPFFRFGMFAEPIPENTTIEYFQIFWEDEKGRIYSFNSNREGLGEDRFAYILRNYYYQNKTEELLEILQQHSKESKEVAFWYFVSYEKYIKEEKTDSIIIKKWQVSP